MRNLLSVLKIGGLVLLTGFLLEQVLFGEKSDFPTGELFARSGGTVVGPQLPNGSINPGPQTPLGGHDGYDPEQPIRGFGQLHVSGTGSGKYGQFLLTPQRGELRVGENEHDSPKSNEVISPYYYAVTLDRYGIRAEMTPAHYSAIYRFSYPETDEAFLGVDIKHNITDIVPWLGEGFVKGYVEFLDEHTLKGSGVYMGGFGGWEPYSVYFYAQWDKTPSEKGVWLGDVVHTGWEGLNPDHDPQAARGGFLKFEMEEGEAVHFKIAVSLISIANAKRLLEAEIPDFDFQQVCHQAKRAWSEKMEQIHVQGGSELQRDLFYTSLFYTQLMPRDRSLDNPWGTDESYWDDHYAIWDTWRTKFPLMTLLDGGMVAANVKAFVARHQRSPWVSDTFIAGQEMMHQQGGDNVDNVIVEAWRKDIPGVDWQKAYAVIKEHADRQRHSEYLEKGWFSETGSSIMSGSYTLEYAYNDWLASVMAEGLGHFDDAERWRARSGQWEAIWNPSIVSDEFRGMIHPRDSEGDWVEYDPKKNYQSWQRFFYEDSAWCYSFFVPHNLPRLIELMGGEERFIERLEYALREKYVRIENEPAFLLSRLFHYADRPDLSSQWTHSIMHEYFNGQYPWDDDSGAMSSWYIFSSIGIFPNAGKDYYFITTPVFEKTTIRLWNGKVFTIRTERKSAGSLYITGAILNGKPFERSWIRHDEIMSGGELILQVDDHSGNWPAHPFTPEKN